VVLGGIGSVVLAQSMSQTIVGSQHLTSLVGIAPLVTIPHLYTASETMQISRMKSYAMGGALFFGLIVVIIFNYAVMPLDVLWSVFTQRLGLS